ncbi:MAG: hypothetical protein GXY82_04610 [Methanospirillum sp.]|nr:hypothetical protein [Methanospirillum sp.]
MDHAEDLRATLRARIRGADGSDGTGSGPSAFVPCPAGVGSQILDEVRRIRILLEERR